jgi:16S rRNA A1518/A1519 N6-dimethyltransferase RsmA/KsgA/DIM1 with predicted DNA glycosylase/AP lyase activity
MLINNLKHAKLLERISEAVLKETILKAGIDGKRRGETLSLHEFGNLSNTLKNRLNTEKRGLK